MTIYRMNAAFVQSGRWFFPEAYCITDDRQAAYAHFSSVLPSLYPDVKIVKAVKEIADEDVEHPFIIHNEPEPIDRLYATDLHAPDKTRPMIALRLEIEKKGSQP
jgi:hypothetical protein